MNGSFVMCIVQAIELMQPSECQFQGNPARFGARFYHSYFIPLIYSGVPSSVKAILIDATEKHREEALIKAKEIAEAANRYDPYIVITGENSKP